MTHASSPGEGTPATAPAAGSGSAASGPTAGSRSATSAPAARTGWAAAYPAEAADPHCLAEGEGAELLRGAPWRRFAVVGDSLAEGLGDPQRGYRTGSWADRTAEALLTAAPDAVHTNLGMRGLTTAQVRERQADRAAAFAPDLVAVVCGGNDLLLPGFSPAVVAREMDLLFGRLAAPGTTLLTFALANVAAAVPELRGGPLEKGVARLNGIVRRSAERHGAVLVEMYDHPAVGDRDLYSADLVHATARGHAVIAAATIRALSRQITAGAGSCPQA
ncbi:SGNH/GDSL hydrolase family protein [Streptomyces sp. NBC_01198]|uniref:SGNH/GDSL hydrolase family protein n=1 Tax=Streptomyces sp. NBC_01198 TaxID=2903769 RepID=UPI002E0F99AA|nr:SGNH/GDSL hydrolase family protein [Streptomyces sp. NBC_01198]